MKYRIKNPEVEKAVRGLFKTQEDFEAQLNLECEKQKHSVYRIFRIAIEPNLCVLNSDSSVSILKSDVEEVVEYDSKVWNEYPKVKPPKEGWYRIQYEVDCVGYVRRVVYWNGKEWETHCSFVEKYAFSFKPWDDDGDCFQIGKEQVNDSVKKVELTVEEAKAINNLILKLFYNEENRMSVFDATELLTKRIEQSGGK